jgi:hypothetical protein
MGQEAATTEENVDNLESEYQDLSTKITKSFEELTETELEMLRQNMHPGIQDGLDRLAHAVEQRILLSRSRRDIEIEKILKEFEASKTAAISETCAIERELASSLQRSLLKQLEALEQKAEPMAPQKENGLSGRAEHQPGLIACTLTSAEIQHDLDAISGERARQGAAVRNQ